MDTTSTDDGTRASAHRPVNTARNALLVLGDLALLASLLVGVVFLAIGIYVLFFAAY